MQKIKQLRQAINCTIQQAKHLLQATDNDIEQATTLFHQSNIDELIKTYDSPTDMAEKYYHDTQQDITKTKKILAKIMEERKHLLRIFTMQENKFRKREVGFMIWGEDKNSEDVDWGDNYNFIPTDDFDLLISSFKAVFPIYNYWCQEPQSYFDATDHNTFDKQQMAKIINNIRKVEVTNDIETQFINEVTIWLTELSKESEIVVVEGNL